MSLVGQAALASSGGQSPPYFAVEDVLHGSETRSKAVGRALNRWYVAEAQGASMATASSRGKTVRPAQSATLLFWRDALFSWGVPLLLAGAIGVIAFLGAFDEIAQSTGIVALGWLLLLLLLFFLLQSTFATGDARLRPWMLTFGLAWLAITWTQVYFTVFVGQQVFTGTVGMDGATALSLEASGTVYDLVVEGNFVTAPGGVGREAGYNLSLEQGGQPIQSFTGVLSEHWGRQRLGRRGSASVRQLHNHGLHRFPSPGEGTYQLKATRIDGQLTPTLTVTLYRDTYPQKTFWVLSLLLLVGAYLLEVLYLGKDAGLVLATAGALAFVLIFPHLGVPPHTYQNLIGAVMVAAMAGPLGGWLFRTLADAVWKALGVSKTEVKGPTQGKEKVKKGRG